MEVTKVLLSRRGPFVRSTWDDQSAVAGTSIRYSVITGALAAGPWNASEPYETAVLRLRALDRPEAELDVSGSWWMLVAAGNSCGASDFGSSSADPAEDPRDALATQPLRLACP